MKYVLATALLAFGVATPSFANENSTQMVFKVQGSVPVECELRSQAAFTQIGPDSYRVASVDRFCNTNYQLSVSHSAVVSIGDIRLGQSQAELQSGSVILVVNGAPIDGRDELIISGVSALTAQAIAQSLSLHVSPRHL